MRSIDRVIGFDADPDVTATFAERVGFLGLDVDTSGPVGSSTIVGEVDVLCTCTSVDIGAGPVIADGATRDWLHVNAVGADFPGKLELPSTLVNGSFVVPDTLAQCLLEGECQQVSSDRIGPALSELVQRADEYTDRREQLTVFDSTGWAVEDDVALRLAVELATLHGVGSEIELERLPRDPYDPYGDV